MKNIRFILMGLIVSLLISCTNDGGKSKIDLSEGAVPNLAKIATTDQGIDVVALKAGKGINLGLTVDVAFGNVASMDIVGIYTKGTKVEKAVIKSNITGFPATVNINQTDLFNAFSILNSASDVDLKDKLIISTDLKLIDGSTVQMYKKDGSTNFGSGIANLTGIKVSQSYVVSCPLVDASLFSGNYKIVTDDWADYTGSEVIKVVYDEANGKLKFRVLNSVNPSTIASSSSNYLDCTLDTAKGTVTVVSNAPYLYGAGASNSFTVKGTGTVGSCSGDINLTLTWTRSSGSFPDQKFNLVKI